MSWRRQSRETLAHWTTWSHNWVPWRWRCRGLAGDGWVTTVRPVAFSLLPPSTRTFWSPPLVRTTLLYITRSSTANRLWITICIVAAYNSGKPGNLGELDKLFWEIHESLKFTQGKWCYHKCWLCYSIACAVSQHFWRQPGCYMTLGLSVLSVTELHNLVGWQWMVWNGWSQSSCLLHEIFCNYCKKAVKLSNWVLKWFVRSCSFTLCSCQGKTV